MLEFTDISFSSIQTISLGLVVLVLECEHILMGTVPIQSADDFRKVWADVLCSFDEKAVVLAAQFPEALFEMVHICGNCYALCKKVELLLKTHFASKKRLNSTTDAARVVKTMSSHGKTVSDSSAVVIETYDNVSSDDIGDEHSNNGDNADDGDDGMNRDGDELRENSQVVADGMEGNINVSGSICTAAAHRSMEEEDRGAFPFEGGRNSGSVILVPVAAAAGEISGGERHDADLLGDIQDGEEEGDDDDDDGGSVVPVYTELTMINTVVASAASSGSARSSSIATTSRISLHNRAMGSARVVDKSVSSVVSGSGKRVLKDASKKERSLASTGVQATTPEDAAISKRLLEMYPHFGMLFPSAIVAGSSGSAGR